MNLEEMQAQIAQQERQLAQFQVQLQSVTAQARRLQALAQQALEQASHHALEHTDQGQDPIVAGELTGHTHSGIGGGGGGAPIDARYLTTTSNTTLTNEVVVGTTPGGELGGTWASPLVDAVHSGSAHGVSTVAENGVALTVRPTLNFAQGLTAVDNSPSNRIDVTWTEAFQFYIPFGSVKQSLGI